MIKDNTTILYSSIKKLIERRKNFNIDIKDSYGYTPLLYIVQKFDLDDIKFLIENGANPFEKTKNGSNILHIIVRDRLDDNKTIEILEYLIDVIGLNIDSEDNVGITPLAYSIVQDKLNIFKYLIKNGADLFKKVSDKNMFDLMNYIKDVDFKDYIKSYEFQKIILDKSDINNKIDFMKNMKNRNLLNVDIKEEHYDLDFGSDLGTI